MSIRPSDGHGPVVDSIDSVPKYQAILERAVQGGWDSVEPVLATWPPDEVAYALSFFVGPEVPDVILPRTADQASPLGLTALAFAHLAEAFRLTLATAGLPDADQALAIRQPVIAAELLLLEACAAQPDLAAAWTARVECARILGLPISEARRRHARAGDALPAHLFMLDRLTGDDTVTADQVDAFVERIVEAAPTGSLTPVLEAQRQLDRYLAAGGDAPGHGVMDVDRLRAAAHRSVRDPSRSQLTPLGVLAHTTFLVAFLAAGEPDDAVAHRIAVGDRTVLAPWRALVSHPRERDRLWNDLVARGEAVA